jgi:hypothetical protein
LAETSTTAALTIALSPASLINAFSPRGRVRATGGLGYGPGPRHRLA